MFTQLTIDNNIIQSSIPSCAGMAYNGTATPDYIFEVLGEIAI